MKNKMVAFLMVICLVIAGMSGVLAVGSETEAFTEQFLQTHGFLEYGLNTPQGYAFVDDAFYVYMRDGKVYRWAPGSTESALYSSLPKRPILAKEELDNAVFSLVPFEDELWAFSVFSGKFGQVTPDSIRWADIRLDTTLLTQSGSAYPSTIWSPFVHEGKLYGLFDLSWNLKEDAPSQTVLLSFDLTDGSCKSLNMPGTLSFCEYKPGFVLLLRRGRASLPILSVMNLTTGEISDMAFEISIELARVDADDPWAQYYTIGALAYRPQNEQIAFTYLQQIWLSTAGNPFAKTDDLPANPLTPDSKGWFLSDGRYAACGAGIYVRNLE